MTSAKIAVSINASWNFINFRTGLIAALQAAGYELVALAPLDEYSDRLEALGVRLLPIDMDAGGRSPWRDARLAIDYYRRLKSERPALYLGFTAKPNIYGSLAAQLLGITVINNVAGLGIAYTGRGWLSSLVSTLYRVAFRRSHTVFFQNKGDRDRFLAAGIVGAGQARLLPGSGIDLEHFRPRQGEGEERRGGPAFLMSSRLLWDKGVREYAEAARIVRRRHPEARFWLLGFANPANPKAVPAEAIEGWVAEGLIEFLGAVADVRPFVAAADCVVLPSFYPEGTPRALLEGAAMAKPLITTDRPGCREVVEDGLTGYLCAPKDALSLAEAMMCMIALTPPEREAMGERARRKAEKEFDEKIVIDRYLEAIEEALRQRC
ncbi:MAG: glycosyltransferase family 4 protein [Sphingomonadaceae bacterium]